MNKNLYALRDIKINELMNVVMLKNQAEAERFFAVIVQDKRSPIHGHPKDYAILELGGIDTETGILVPARIPKDVTPHSWVDYELNRRESEKNTNG